MVFDVVGHPDQPEGGGGQQQGADRGVGGAVGDVEQPAGVGVPFEAAVQPFQRGIFVGQWCSENVVAHGFSSSG